MSFGHDYMGHIVQPFACSLSLFFASGAAWQTFGCLAIWCVFMAVFSRYIHLRSTRRCFFTTNRLDTEALFAWGLCQSMVLAASSCWAARLWGWPIWIVPLCWLGGASIYGFLLATWVRPLLSSKDEAHAFNRPSYDALRARRYYDWDNCNPIKVLLSHCGDQQDPQHMPITPFEIGKEYLQAANPLWQSRMRRAALSAMDMRLRAATLPEDEMGTDKPEAWSWNHNWLPDLLHVPEVETLVGPLVQRPLDALDQMGRHFASGKASSSRHTEPEIQRPRVSPRVSPRSQVNAFSMPETCDAESGPNSSRTGDAV